MDPDSTTRTLLLLAALLAANAFFVITEFSLLTLRRGRVEQEARAGDPGASRVLRALNRVEELSLVSQLGRSLTTLALGYYSIAFVTSLLAGWRVPVGTSLMAGLVVAGLVHAVLGEQLPKLVGVRRGAWVATHLVAGPLRWIALPLRPLTWAVCRVISALARAGRFPLTGLAELAHTPEEIQMLVARGQEEGMVEEDEREMIDGVFEFSDTVAREVMTPRIDMVAVPVDVELPELIRTVVEEGHSRLPVYEGTIDSVIGVLLAKDLLPLLRGDRPASGSRFDLREVMREPYFVPEGKPVGDILAEFRQQSVHLALVVDEFGGTSGLVTMEDLLEEIVGDINDEHDVAEPEFAPTPEGDVLIDGGASLSDVNDRFGLRLPEEEYDTLGGYVFGTLGRVPVVGDEVTGAGGEGNVLLLVERTEDRRVVRVRLTMPAAIDLSAVS
jgi:putative hemolysin